jgi:transposase
MEKSSTLPPLPRRGHVRGRRPHDPGFDVRTALYRILGLDLTAMEGFDELHALTLISELGTDRTKWPTVKPFTSWLGLCPNFKKTGGKVKSSKTRRGKGRAAYTFRLAAWSLMRSKSDLGATLRRLRSRLGAPKAITAMAHKLARIFDTVLRYGVEYPKRSEAEYVAEHRERQERNLQKRARELGYELRKIGDSPPAPT